MLDTEEHLHLAFHAASMGDPHSCLRHLDEVLRARSDDPRALYLRAVQHARIGLIDRAIEGLHSAVISEPNFEAARFHLALLMLDRDRSDEARQHFMLLAGSRDSHFEGYAAGLVALIDGDKPAAIQRLSAALQRETADNPLAATMSALLGRLTQEEQPTPRQQEAHTQEERPPVNLGAYGRAPAGA